MAREVYREKLRVWHGATERELVSHWGPSTSVYEIDGDRHLTYLSSKTFRIGYSRYQTLPCKLIFSIEGGVVVQWSFQGGGCH